MNFLAATRYRYTTKAYDATRRIPEAQLDELLEGLRHSPSSVNSQPWHFVVASDAAGKTRIAKATEAGFGYNTPKVTNASHVIVFAARTELPAAHTTALLDQEDADGRFRIEGARAGISLAFGRPYPLPLSFSLVERHPLGSQAFVPMSEDPFLVVVAPDEGGRPGTPLAFLAGPGQGVNYLRNVWHGVLTPLARPARFLIVDRIGSGNNLEEFRYGAAWTVTTA